MKYFFLTLSLLFANAANAEEHLLLETDTDTCIVKSEANPEQRVIMIRLSNKENADCVLNEAQLLDLIYLSLSSAVDVKYDSIFLRSIEDYEWLSKHLVENGTKHKDWPKNHNKAANETLSSPKILDVINNETKSLGYEFTGFSCEKVLVSSNETKPYAPAWVKANKKPYDALCWLVTKKD